MHAGIRPAAPFEAWRSRQNFLQCLLKNLLDGQGVRLNLPAVVPVSYTHLYGDLLKSNEFTRTDFAQYLDYPCTLIHDAEAAAFAELWHLKLSHNAIYLSLNNFLGSAFIFNGSIVHSQDLSSGTIEHMCLYPNGNECYCGKKGCVDAYCSANSLIKNAGENIEDFFSHVKKGSPPHVEIWHNYLRDLAITIDNIRMVISSDIVIGGILQPFITDEDLQLLNDYVKTVSYTHLYLPSWKHT